MFKLRDDFDDLQKSYWCGSRVEDDNGSSSTGQEDDEDQQYFEKEPAGLKPGIVIKNLRYFGRSVHRTWY